MSKCYDNPEHDKPSSDIQNTWNQFRHKQSILEEAAEILYPTTIDSFTDTGIDMSETERLIFINGAKWQQEQHDFLPGFIKQFDPKEGEIDGEEWTAFEFLRWLESNKFKIIK